MATTQPDGAVSAFVIGQASDGFFDAVDVLSHPRRRRPRGDATRRAAWRGRRHSPTMVPESRAAGTPFRTRIGCTCFVP